MKLNENNWIYLGYRLGLLGMIVAVVWLLVVMFSYESVGTILPWAIGLFVFGFVAWRMGKSRWDKKYIAGLPVPCLICSKEFTSKEAPLGPDFRARVADITCPHCGKSVEY